jgi:hypothetical protein
VNYRELLFQKLLAMHDAIIAGATREANRAATATTAAPAQPSSTGFPSPVVAAPAQPTEPKTAEVISLQAAALKAGYYISGSRSQSIDDEFPPDPVTSNWRATLDRPAPRYEPDPFDVTCADAVSRAYEAQQVRISTEQNRK